MAFKVKVPNLLAMLGIVQPMTLIVLHFDYLIDSKYYISMQQMYALLRQFPFFS